MFAWKLTVKKFEADRRAINITINSFGTELTKDDRVRLFASLGRLYPDGHSRLARADEIDHVRSACEAHLVRYYKHKLMSHVGVPWIF